MESLDVMAYTTAITGCSEAREYAHALSLMAEMRREGIRPNVVTFSAAKKRVRHGERQAGKEA